MANRVYSGNERIVCSTSNVDRVHNHSLIYHVSNRGASGEDACVLLAYPDHRVGITCTEIHDVNSISISTAVEVTETTTSEVIITMKQCA